MHSPRKKKCNLTTALQECINSLLSNLELLFLVNIIFLTSDKGGGGRAIKGMDLTPYFHENIKK